MTLRPWAVFLGLWYAWSVTGVAIMLWRNQPDQPATRKVGLLPNDFYGDLWVKMEQCSGQTRPRSEIEFSVVEGADIPMPELVTGRWWWSKRVLGVYEDVHQEPDRIMIAQTRLFDGGIVGHEILHALGFKHGDPIFRHCGVVSSPPDKSVGEKLRADRH